MGDEPSWPEAQMLLSFIHLMSYMDIFLKDQTVPNRIFVPNLLRFIHIYFLLFFFSPLKVISQKRSKGSFSIPPLQVASNRLTTNRDFNI